MNITFRKFFDIDAPEVQTSAPSSLAGLMASKGVFTTEDRQAEVPNIITENKETPTTVPEQVPDETSKIASNAETANPETPSPQVETTPQVEPQKVEQPQVKAPTWQEVLKQQPGTVILKELGYDDKVVELSKKLKDNPKMEAFFNHWEANNGDVTTYLKELTTDYLKMPAEEVMRHQLRTEYPKATEKQLDILFKNEIVEKYKLNSEVEEEAEEGRMLLEVKADKLRDTFVGNQQNYLIPKPSQPATVEPDNTQQLRQQQEFEAYKSTINEHPLTKGLITNKQLVVGEGDEKFNYPISEPNDLLNILYDSDAWARSFFSVEKRQDGTEILIPDTEKQLFVAAAVKDYKGLVREIAKHYKALGGQSAIAPIENASKPDGSTPSQSEAKPQTPAEAMAKQGRVTSGGY